MMDIQDKTVLKQKAPQEVILKNTPEVVVKNFPEKTWWEKKSGVIAALSLIATILSLIVAITSFTLYYNEITKMAEINISAESPSPYIGKAQLEFQNGHSIPKSLEFFAEGLPFH